MTDIGQDEGNLNFLVSIIDDDSNNGGTGTKSIFSQRDALELRQIPVTTLRENLHRTVNELGGLFHALATPQDTIALKEVEISFEVTATGRIALLGSSAEASGKGAILLRFVESGSRDRKL